MKYSNGKCGIEITVCVYDLIQNKIFYLRLQTPPTVAQETFSIFIKRNLYYTKL